jgi:hypothetical protein
VPSRARSAFCDRLKLRHECSEFIVQIQGQFDFVGQKLDQTRKNGALDSPKISKIVGSVKFILAV